MDTISKRNHRHFCFWILPASIVCGVILFYLLRLFPAQKDIRFLSSLQPPEWVDIQFLTPDITARKGDKLDALNHIVIHYVGNPGTTAQQNRDYFNTPGTQVCSHFIIGLDGEIIQCIPLDEKSAASNQANRDSISIEVCHPDQEGKFNDSAYQSLVRLCAWLCENCKLDAQALIRHYDVTGKACPVYYVNHPEAWDTLKADVSLYLAEIE